MAKIWYRNRSKSEVIGRRGGDGKPNDHAKKNVTKNKYIMDRFTLKTRKNLSCLTLLYVIIVLEINYIIHFGNKKGITDS